MSDVASAKTKTEFAAQMARRITEALGTEAFPNPDGWRLEGHTLSVMRGGDLGVVANQAPVFAFAVTDRTLEICLADRDADKPAFFRSAHFDIVYRSVSVDHTSRMHDLDRTMLDHFCQWVVSWDGAESAAVTEERASGT